MIYQININEDSYKKLKASLMLTGEDEEVVLERLINQYAHATFEKAMEKNTPEVKTQQAIAQTTSMTNIEQKQAFVKWFRRLKRKNGDHYNLVTISGYAGRIEKYSSKNRHYLYLRYARSGRGAFHVRYRGRYGKRKDSADRFSYGHL